VPQPFLGCLPFVQSLPLTRDRAPLSEPHTPLQSSTDVLRRDHPGFGIPPWFHPLPRSRAVAWIPHGPGSPFSEQARLPVAPDPAWRNRLVPPASPASKSSSLLRVRSHRHRVSPGRRPMLSWLCPSTAFSAYASGPHDPPDPGAPRASTLVLGHPRTPVSTRRTGTRPSLPAGHPTARTRPGPLTRHAPTLPRARGAQ
jgi:hypothetical protein